MAMQRDLPGMLPRARKSDFPMERWKMKGFVPTPTGLVDMMVRKLFFGMPPKVGSAVLDPGCGTGPFMQGVLRWCEGNNASIPRIVGVESDKRHLTGARGVAEPNPTVTIEHRDFLSDDSRLFDYIIGNPPYVAITRLS